MSLNKICRTCSLEKLITEYNYSSKVLGTLDGRCKECVKTMKNNKNKTKMPRELDIWETDIFCTTWQGGKASGTILQKNNKYEVRVNRKSKTCDTIEMALVTKREMSNTSGLTRNQYKIINNKITQEPEYLLVKLSKEQVMVCDYIQLSFIKNNNLCVSKSGTNKNAQYYAMVSIGDKVERFHNIITGFDMVDHINRQPMDNRLCNLRESSYTENNRNRANTKNSSGVTGVRYVEKDHAVQARIKIDNKEHSKNFSINKYGVDEALEKALEWRNEMAEKTNNFNSRNNEQTYKHPDFDRLLQEYTELTRVSWNS